MTNRYFRNDKEISEDQAIDSSTGCLRDGCSIRIRMQARDGTVARWKRLWGLGGGPPR